MSATGGFSLGTKQDEAKRSQVELKGIHHRYGDAVALESIDLTIRPGEFFTLLGASGSGKSTLLHIIAGLQQPTGGTVSVDGLDITNHSPQQRNFGMVFQNYALFPHMSAAGNITFPLEVRKFKEAAVQERLKEMLDLVELGLYADRLPSQLSGGQQQRVAIGRALASLPPVLLLDEPLGALDKRLREQLSAELRTVQQLTGVTAAYVTHDQNEAFTMSDRIGVMDKGHLVQVGTPEDLYHRPVNRFVAEFVGDANMIAGIVVHSDAHATKVRFPHGAEQTFETASNEWSPGVEVVCLIRPEQLVIGEAEVHSRSHVDVVGKARVLNAVFLGGSRQLILDWDGIKLAAKVPSHAIAPTNGQQVSFGWQRECALLLPSDGSGGKPRAQQL